MTTIEHNCLDLIHGLIFQFRRCECYEANEQLARWTYSCNGLPTISKNFNGFLNSINESLDGINYKNNVIEAGFVKLFSNILHFVFSRTRSRVLIAAIPFDKFLSPSTMLEKYLSISKWSILNVYKLFPEKWHCKLISMLINVLLVYSYLIWLFCFLYKDLIQKLTNQNIAYLT